MNNRKIPLGKPYSPDELADGLELIFEKSRDSLTVTDVSLLTEAIETLRSLANPKSAQCSKCIAEQAVRVVLYLLRFFSNRETIEELTKVIALVWK